MNGKYAKRGTASMPVERRREIARKGGIEVHRKGRAHEWTREEAILAGSKGGSSRRKIKGVNDAEN